MSESDDQVELFRALGDPVRLSMVKMLAHQDEVACTTYDQVFDIAKSTISYHVRTLRAAQLITVRKDGSFYHYRIRPETFERLAPGLLHALRAQPLADGHARALASAADAGTGPGAGGPETAKGLEANDVAHVR